VNAYEGKIGMVYLQVKLSDPYLSALRYIQGAAIKKDPIAKIAIIPTFLGEFLYCLHQWKQK